MLKLFTGELKKNSPTSSMAFDQEYERRALAQLIGLCTTVSSRPS